MGTVTLIEPSPEPRRAKFREGKLPAEPKTDVKVKTSDMTLRERVIRAENNHGVSLILTHTRLDENGAVMTNAAGEPMITDRHEIVFGAESFGSMDEKMAKKVLKHGREVAAARAEDYFRGMEKLSSLMASRLT